ncbi:GNAT family N-acetyltransferase [Mobilicoccus caccae]|uniref:GNAT family N-acetyltransferase n=1 Tax=Mobilicoccus caccae TaxID=1859295 RepID=UPI0024E12DD8|nr:GNAT family N-acetyltransferase [Mobilicoccus caccae]
MNPVDALGRRSEGEAVISIRPLTLADGDELLAIDHFAFVADPDEVPAEQSLEGLDMDRTFGAEHDDRPGELAGIYTSFDLRMRVPGSDADDGARLVPMNGLTAVGVHPDMRRRGVLRAMIRHHLEQARDRGDVIAGLHASEPVIYGRFGYSVASHDVHYSLGSGTKLPASEPITALADRTDVRTLLDLDDDTIARRLHELDLVSPALGTVVVPEAVVRRRLRDNPTSRVGKEPRRALIATREGRDVGVAVFRREVTWDDGNADGHVNVTYLTAVDEGALLALGRRLVEMDLMSRVDLGQRGLDDPLLNWAGSVRTRTVRVADALWLRPVEVSGMLTARGYATPLDLTLEVRDDTCDWNSGTWRLVVDETGEAECVRSDADADIRLDVDVIGELFLGLRGARALASLGRITERTPGSVAALNSAFATGIQPIGGTGF